MNPRPIFNRYKRHRFPAEIISHCAWLYFRFCLSYRDVEELMAERGVILTYEAVRYWCRKFGQVYANQLRRRHPRPGEKWHLDEVFLTIKGNRRDLWRAVDQDGNVLDILVQQRRDKKAAKRFFRKRICRKFRSWGEFQKSACREINSLWHRKSSQFEICDRSH
jgi:putative transposase